MTTQTDVQQLIQGLTPTANNGNPNTAYNNSIPVMDGYGNWSSPTVGPAASYTRQPVNLTRSSAPTSWPWDSPNLTSSPVNSAPVPSSGTTSPVPTNGTVPNGATRTPVSGGSGGSSGGGRPGTGGTSFNWFGSAPTGTGGGYTGGAINWNQALDGGLDVFGGLTGTSGLFGGDWYLDGTGTWDTSNILASLGSGLTGLPVGSWMDSIGKYGANNGWSEGNMFVDHYMDNAQNQFDSFQNQFGQDVNNRTTAINEQGGQDAFQKAFGTNPSSTELDKMTQIALNEGTSGLLAAGYTGNSINKFAAQNPSLGLTTVSPQSSAASSSPYYGVVTGDAAREMFQGMKTGSMGQRQMGTDATGQRMVF